MIQFHFKHTIQIQHTFQTITGKNYEILDENFIQRHEHSFMIKCN